jgi:hypothetical protein
MTQWHNLFLPTPHDLTVAVQKTLTDAGYTVYDPFALMPGRAYPQTVKLFIAPPANGWTRIIAAPDAPPDSEMLSALSHTALCLSLALDGDQAAIDVYHQGEKVETVAALTPHLSTSPDGLLAALQKTGTSNSQTSSPFDVVSGDVKTLANKVNMKKAESMFSKMTGKLLNREQQSAANELLNRQPPQWESSGGVRIRAVLACLGLPTDVQPEFVALRDAYQLHNRRRRNPNATLYPGDTEVMEAVANALDYSPVFGGKA